MLEPDERYSISILWTVFLVFQRATLTNALCILLNNSLFCKWKLKADSIHSNLPVIGLSAEFMLVKHYNRALANYVVALRVWNFTWNTVFILLWAMGVVYCQILNTLLLASIVLTTNIYFIALARNTVYTGLTGSWELTWLNLFCGLFSLMKPIAG